MTIVATEQLSTSQQREVEVLEEVVRDEEGQQNRLFLSNRLNWDPLIPCFFLGYHSRRLVSVLSAFFPTAEEVEFSGFTHPEYRNRGFFSLLVKRALAQYATLPFSRALFTAEATVASGQAYLASRYPVIERSEYLMSLERADHTPVAQPGTLKAVTRLNGEEAALLMSRIFFSDLQRSRERVSLMLLEQGRKVFLYYRRGLAIGVLNAQRNAPDTYMIYGVGIAEQHRSQGHGRAMMHLALTELFNEAATLTLEVESTNTHAITLYTSLGFRPVMQMDYHRLSLR
ncbi:MAG: GNAT family N-acetyltransferase [Sphaerochaeta sp.]|nr:GNAT family N-acetyltransferase [Sphaerochaeta sp.]MDX9914931.1 GNAT family N-acetyltransferase [Sphaerochaeta sp.]